MNETERHPCGVCNRADLSLTANGRVRSHAANGKRLGPYNPVCRGSSELPRAVETDDFGQPIRECFHCDRVGCTGCDPVVTASGGPNPYRAPLLDHTHWYTYLDDDNGHSGGFCNVCGAPDPDESAPAYRSPFKSSGHDGEHFALRTGELPHDRNTDPTEETSWTTSTPPNQDPDPGSKPGTTETVTTAESLSTKVTPSGPTETAGTRGRNAAVTTDTQTDAFESAPAAQPEPKRDRWGRYLLPHPATGKRQAWTRATTMAKSISDTFALSQWSQRMAAKGLAMRPDLVAMASTLDVKTDKDKLNSLVEQAKDAAGQKVSANLGTAVHKFTERVDAGEPLNEVPAAHRADVSAYLAAMAEVGLTAIPQLIERITVVPQFDTAGTFDRILRTSDGDFVIGDVKTGRTLEYGWQEIAIQLALYAQGVNQAGVYNMQREEWEPAEQVRTDYGIVMHLPVGEATCTLYRVDLAQGWAAATLCNSVRDWRKNRTLAQPYAVAEYVEPPTPAAVAVRLPTWTERFAAVSSRGEAMGLYVQALESLGKGPELAALVKVGMGKLATLEERAG